MRLRRTCSSGCRMRASRAVELPGWRLPRLPPASERLFGGRFRGERSASPIAETARRLGDNRCAEPRVNATQLRDFGILYIYIWRGARSCRWVARLLTVRTIIDII